MTLRTERCVLEEVINSMEDPLVGARDENSLEEIRSQQIEPYSTSSFFFFLVFCPLCLNVTNTFILSLSYVNTFIRFIYTSARIRVSAVTIKLERLIVT